MLYSDRNDVSEGIDVNKTSGSKVYDICHYWYYFKIPGVSLECGPIFDSRKWFFWVTTRVPSMFKICSKEVIYKTVPKFFSLVVDYLLL